MNRTKKIEELRLKLNQLEAAERAAVARVRVSKAAKTRAEDTRRKILLGAFLSEYLGSNPVAGLALGQKQFNTWLTRPADRELFSLPPIVGDK